MQLRFICEKLSPFNIKDTFCHADFHDKNVLIDTHSLKTTIIDLGEVAVTYPFFSFLNCLHMAKENFALPDPQYEKIKLECFKPWLQFETQENLYEIHNIMHQCWAIHSVLSEYRVLNSIDRADYENFSKQGRFAKKLQLYWINNRDI